MCYTDHLELYQLNIGGRNGKNGFLVQQPYCYFSKGYVSELLLMDNFE